MTRFFAALFLSAFLAACTSAPVPPGPATGEPRLTADAFVAADGARLPMRVWLPEGRPRAVILAMHGFNDYSNAFALPAPFLTAHGIALYAYDQRGFGAAPNPGSWPGESALTGDAVAAARLVAARHPDIPFYLLGESMGGAVVIRAMARADAPHVAGVILVAPAVWARQRMNVFERAALWVTSRVLPWFPVNGSGLDIWPSDNIPMLRALSNDPLVLKNTKLSTLDGLVDLMDAAYASGPALKGPALFLYGEHDEVVPAKPTYDVMTALRGRRDITLAVYAKSYHMMLRDIGADTVLSDMVAWIGDHAAPLPSGADHRAAEVLEGHRAASVMAADAPAQ